MKIKDLKKGMKEIDLTATIDYVTPLQRGSSSEAWGIVYIDDGSKDIKLILYGEAVGKAKEGMKVRIKDGYVTEYNGELQINTKKESPVEFLE